MVRENKKLVCVVAVLYIVIGVLACVGVKWCNYIAGAVLAIDGIGSLIVSLILIYRGRKKVDDEFEDMED